jgi:hypothetical protein
MMLNQQHEEDNVLEAQFIPSASGVTVVNEFGMTVLDQSSLKIVGNVDNVDLALNPPLNLDKFTLMKLRIIRANDVTELKVCLFQGDSDVASLFVCFFLGYTEIEVPVGEMFLSKGAASEGITISKIRFSQAANNSKSSILSQISFKSSPQSVLFDIDGNCKDPNAMTIKSFEICECKQGFVSSDGGIFLSENASCVACLVSEYCHFEGRSCESNSNCFSKLCIEGICKQHVSTKVPFYFFVLMLQPLTFCLT